MSNGKRLHLFAGKGGAGKTTHALSYALGLTERFPNDKIAVLSLESGRALADLLKKKLSPKPLKVHSTKGKGGLWAVELDWPESADTLRKPYAAALSAVAQKGALLAADEAGRVVEAGLTGSAELTGLLWISQALESAEFDRIVVDLGGVGRAIRTIDLPAVEKRRLLAARGAAPKVKKEAPSPSYLDELQARLDGLAALLKDPTRTGAHIVALAEPVAELQTKTLFTELRTRAVAIEEIVATQIEEKDGCNTCQGRRGLQAPHIRKYQALDKAVPVRLVRRRDVAAKGLEEIAALLTESTSAKEAKALEFAASEGPPALVRAPSMPPIAAPPLPPTRMIFFVGQGGVGKSSCAAAAAVTLTEKEGPVLLLSLDPAHTLSEITQSRLGDTESQVKGTKGLYAREIDFTGWFNGLRKRIKEKTDRIFEPAKGGEGAYDRELLRGLLDTAPLGMDELPGLAAIAEALLAERFKRIVVDPAPNIDRVRLLELPALARPWLAALVDVLTKYKAKGTGELVDELSNLLRYLKRFEDGLAAPNEARFVVVTRGDELSQTRTERLVDYLRERKLNVERVIVNRVMPKTTCDKCEGRRNLELTVAKNLEKKIGLTVTVAPALGRFPAGLRELKAFRTSWYALTAPATKTTKAA